MLACWKVIPERRPLFDELEEHISNMMDRNATEQYIAMNEPYLKMNAIHLNNTDYIALLGSPDCESPSIPMQRDENIQEIPDLIAPTTRLNSASLNPLNFVKNPMYFSSDA